MRGKDALKRGETEANKGNLVTRHKERILTLIVNVSAKR